MFGFKPSVPDITNEIGVIEWFLKHDEKIKDFKKHYSPSEINEFKGFVLKDLENNNSAQKLADLMKLFEEQHTELLAKAASSYNIKQNLNRPLTEEEVVYSNLVRAESFIATKLRILGYFLLKKYGVNPLAETMVQNVKKNKVTVSQVGKKLGEGFSQSNWVLSLSTSKPMILKNNVSIQEAFFILLAFELFTSDIAVFSKTLLKVVPKDIYKKIGDYMVSFALSSQKQFACENVYMEEYAKYVNEIRFKLHDVWMANLNNTTNPPHWFLAKTIVGLLENLSKASDYPAIAAIEKLAHEKIMIQINFWESTYQKFDIVPE